MNLRYTILWIVIFIQLFSSSLEAQDRLVISRTDYALAPGSLMGERILKEAYSRIGREFELQTLPSVRAIDYANKGRTDGTFLRVAGLERVYPNLVMINIPIGYEEIVVYTKKMNFEVDGWQSLSPYTIGLVRGFKLADINTEGMRVERVNDFKHAFLKLDFGRTDVIVDVRSKQCLLKKLNLSGIHVLAPPLGQIELYHYLHTRHKDLAAELEVVLMLMKQEGELKIIQEQAVEDFQKSCGP